MNPRGTANETKNQQREKNGKEQNIGQTKPSLLKATNLWVYICIHRAPNDLSQQISGLKKLRDSFPPSTECTIRSEGDDHRATLEQPEGWHKSLVFHHRYLIHIQQHARRRIYYEQQVTWQLIYIYYYSSNVV